jgi:YYY domain-containing protein
MSYSETTATGNRKKRGWKDPLTILALVVILTTGAFFRLVGSDWGENTFMHPDERFLLMVGSALEPVGSFSEYFDTANSSLNPHNRNFGFYVYGTLPMFLARYAVEAYYGQSGLVEMLTFGRALSALADILTVLLVFAIGSLLYGRAAGLLASAFMGLMVLHIQQSHFFTMDTFITFFTVLAIYFSVRVVTDSPKWKMQDPTVREESAEELQDRWEEVEEKESFQPEPSSPGGVSLHSFAPPIGSPRLSSSITRFASHPLFFLSIGFGTALGMAVASKLNAVPVAMMLPVAVGVYLLSLPSDRRWGLGAQLFWYLVLAAAVSILVFRIFQPYAFQGPGFFGMLPNQQWVNNIMEQRIQAAGDVDFPPAMQWARRPITFSFENMVIWGMGLPLGLLAWGGFLWMGWRILNGEWRSHLLLWGWTAFYFAWQSLQFNPTMRYQMPIYPTLAIIAAWAVVRLWKSPPSRVRFHKPLSLFLGISVLGATFAWAYAFSQIYIRPFTRVEASRWIFENIPGPINLPLQTGDGVYNQMLPFPYNALIRPDSPYQAGFLAHESGILEEVFLPRLQGSGLPFAGGDVTLVVSNAPYGEEPLATVYSHAAAGQHLSFYLDQPLHLDQNQSYYLTLTLPPGEGLVNLCGPLEISIQTPERIMRESIPGFEGCLSYGQLPFTTSFSIPTQGIVDEFSLDRVEEIAFQISDRTLEFTIKRQGETEILASASASSTFSGEEGEAGFSLIMDTPIQIHEGEYYEVLFQLHGGPGALSLQGGAVANEGDWDDGLPLRLDNYDPYGGIYQPGLAFHMYMDDNPEKLDRFLRVLDQSDYIVISSNRQWGSLPRIPERFPLVTTYYRNLLGCPLEQTIEWCYRVAEPGSFQGNLGFELVQVFQSDPSIGPIRITTQFAEEAFTVYDHPKVLIFHKTEEYDPGRVQEILGEVDFSRVIRVTPKRASSHPADLMLPVERLVEQRVGGTWSEIFDTQALQNRSQPVGVLLWYGAIFLLGLAAYPLVRLGLSGLPDRGYPLARIAGLLLLSFLTWTAGSLRIPFNQGTVAAAFLVILISGAALAYVQREGLRRDWRERRSHFLVIEGLFLGFFLFGLFLRLANPDLWHPYFGGEKPMDFAYFNAVLKSTTFPPYDPWFTGGYLNYYYYGFVLVGVITKLLAIVPAIAINLILPTIFAMIAMGAFSIAWNLYTAGRRLEDDEGKAGLTIKLSHYLVGLAGALFMVVLGNLGTVRMILLGFQRLAAPGGVVDEAGPITRLIWMVQGFGQAVTGSSMPYARHEWYWNPSRVMAPGDNAITEFPFFTVLYADPHAHLFALPVALLALGFAVSVLLSRVRFKSALEWAGALFLGGLAIGALYPINLSDIYTYLPLGMAALIYTTWRYYQPGEGEFLNGMAPVTRRVVIMVSAVLLLVGLAFLLYQPYRSWYGQGFSSVVPWTGIRTPTGSYITHWGLFLFVFISWLAWETREWMANTPLSALRKLTPYKAAIQVAALFLILAVGILLYMGVHIAWMALPLAAWAGLLLLRPGMPDARRAALFLIGTGLAITVMVELIEVQGDISRMNTVFKFYLQAWTIFAVSAAAAVGWMAASLHRWSQGWRLAWQVPLTVLIFSGALYTLLGGMAKVTDRMSPQAPNTLDGMAYMRYSTYDNLGTLVDLDQDYHGIRWMQENVAGSPTIVEASSGGNQYRWFSRYSIYTGLPGVVGWEWHQIQQRLLAHFNWPVDRGREIDQFYRTLDVQEAVQFLNKYDVSYIILGQVERGAYPGPGLEKFSEQDGILWQEVYRDRDTVIYEVIG